MGLKQQDRGPHSEDRIDVVRLKAYHRRGPYLSVVRVDGEPLVVLDPGDPRDLVAPEVPQRLEGRGPLRGEEDIAHLDLRMSEPGNKRDEQRPPNRLMRCGLTGQSSGAGLARSSSSSCVFWNLIVLRAPGCRRKLWLKVLQCCARDM
jgi:hypothetical protein